MDEETKGWIELLSARIDALEEVREGEDEDDKHDEGKRLEWIVIGLIVLELITAIWGIYATYHHA